METTTTQSMDEFKKNEVIPDVIGHEPEQILEVSWPHSNINAQLGNIATPHDMQNQPRVHWDADAHSYYTLIMTDPDAPSRQSAKAREWHHWLVVNIPGNNVSQGDEKTAYVGSGPPKDSGLHRYVFLVFKQMHGKQEFKDVPIIDNQTAKHREKFNTKQFFKHHHLEKLVAANFVQAQWDESVPATMKRLH